MLDFKSTFDSNNEVHFCNEYGEVLKSYPMTELEKYVIENSLNAQSVSANGCISSDPSIIEEDEETPVEDYINNEWFSITEKFYNDRNK